MKLCSLVAVGLLLLMVKPQGIAAPSPAGGPSHALPAALSLERYRPMMERSPFAVASEAAPAQPVAAAGFAKDLVLTGAVRLGGSEFVTISSRDQTQRFGLKTGETYNGISVVSVAWSDAVGKTKATLKSGSEFGVIGFDEALMRNNAAPTPELTPFANNAQPMPPGILLSLRCATA
ncbi:MAG: hypothetical protein NTZ46_11735 [Verrucomicrobia bacterium]|nr:hypothetical protein [Verrucomicrobiota bacterium]